MIVLVCTALVLLASFLSFLFLRCAVLLVYFRRSQYGSIKIQNSR